MYINDEYLRYFTRVFDLEVRFEHENNLIFSGKCMTKYLYHDPFFKRNFAKCGRIFKT